MIDEANYAILKKLRKVEINIPPLDVIKHVPHQAKFLKDLCIAKCKLKGNKKVCVGQNLFVFFLTT